jgi:hypothetical protein
MFKRTMMKAIAPLLVLAAFAVVAGSHAAAQTQQRFDRLTVVRALDGPPLSCKANKMYSCSAAGCETEDHPTGLPVEFEMKTAEGKGYLCTYTYCRSFTLMGWRGRPAASGLVWSSSSGSTPPADSRPAYDYTLSLAEDWGSFTLAAAGNGAVSGYTGTCSRPTP